MSTQTFTPIEPVNKNDDISTRRPFRKELTLAIHNLLMSAEGCLRITLTLYGECFFRYR
ncbi:MAG TPA: hypothetical protein H9825_10855 [Candidatus Sphingobacterium stercorigallinarum]|nr:hypothetical protein [Candidatus Sphingobacterium stercorigallinarum]